MKSPTYEATPNPVPADQAATGAPAAENARRTALTRIARPVRFIGEIVTVILLGECGVPPAEAATGLAATRRRRAGGS
ncbi:MAG: hypothetical protein ACRDOA_15150 [Streptosporangiaceae bacterium]